MHDSRIAGLEDRLVRLAAKEAAGVPRAILAPDRARTAAELALLRGIQARNLALGAEAPAVAAAAAARDVANRAALEAAQLAARTPEEAAADDARDTAARATADAERPGVDIAERVRRRIRKVREAVQFTPGQGPAEEGA